MSDDYMAALARAISDNSSEYKTEVDAGVRSICRTGSLALDDALGIGGWPEKRISMFGGKWSSGKTTIALLSIADFQRRQLHLNEDERRVAVFVDAEQAHDLDYAKFLGVDNDKLVVATPPNEDGVISMNSVLDCMWNLINSGKVGFLVWDSVASCATDTELASQTGAANIAQKARLLSSSLPSIVGSLAKNDCAALFLNQIRKDPSCMFGDPEYFPGGEALYHACSIIIKGGPSARNESSCMVKGKVLKNKCFAKPMAKFSFKVEVGIGIDNETQLIEEAVQYGIITKKGSHYYNKSGEKLAQGKDGFKKWLKSEDGRLEGFASAVGKGRQSSKEV